MNENSEEILNLNFDKCIPIFQCKLFHENETLNSSISNNNNYNNSYNPTLNLDLNSVENGESVLGNLTNISLLSAFHCSPSLFL